MNKIKKLKRLNKIIKEGKGNKLNKLNKVGGEFKVNQIKTLKILNQLRGRTDSE